MPVQISTELRQSAHTRDYWYKYLHTGGMFSSAWQTFLLLPHLWNPWALISSSSWGGGDAGSPAEAQGNRGHTLLLRRKLPEIETNHSHSWEKYCLASKINTIKNIININNIKQNMINIHVASTRIVFYLVRIQKSKYHTNKFKFMDVFIFFFPALKTLYLWLLGWIHTYKSNISMARIY